MSDGEKTAVIERPTFPEMGGQSTPVFRRRSETNGCTYNAWKCPFCGAVVTQNCADRDEVGEKCHGCGARVVAVSWQTETCFHCGDELCCRRPDRGDYFKEVTGPCPDFVFCHEKAADVRLPRASEGD